MDRPETLERGDSLTGGDVAHQRRWRSLTAVARSTVASRRSTSCPTRRSAHHPNAESRSTTGLGGEGVLEFTEAALEGLDPVVVHMLLPLWSGGVGLLGWPVPLALGTPGDPPGLLMNLRLLEAGSRTSSG
jgi:hypothetical protein